MFGFGVLLNRFMFTKERSMKWIILVLLVIVLAPEIARAQTVQINFTVPTSVNATQNALNWTYVNMTVTSVNALHTALLSFNGTNYTLDEPSLVFINDFNSDGITHKSLNSTGRFNINLSPISNLSVCNLTQGRYGYGCNFREANTSTLAYLNNTV